MAEWISYATTLEDGKTELDVDFDASLTDDAFRSAHPIVVQLAISGFEAGADGIPTDAADDVLFAIGERFDRVLDGKGALAVTLLSPGTYDLLLYVRDASLEAPLASAATQDNGLSCKSSSSSDPTWSLYSTWALVDDELESARDIMQFDQWCESELYVDGEVAVTFDFEYDTAEAAKRGDDALRAAGFDVEEYLDDENVVDSNLAEITLTMTPTADAISDARRRMTGAVAPYGGRFLGWGVDGEHMEGDER